MTSKESRKEDFFKRCVEASGSTVRIGSSADRKREAERFRSLSEYHRKAVEDHLSGQARLMAIEEGYYVMLHKANETLAMAGFRPKTHECTLLGLRGIFNAPDLADDLRRAYHERRNVDYYMNPEKPELEEFKDPEDFVENVMNPFIKQVQKLIESF